MTVHDKWPYGSGSKTAGTAIYSATEPPNTRKRVIDARCEDDLPRVWLVYLANPGPQAMEYFITAGDDTGGAFGEAVTVPVFGAARLQVAGSYLQVNTANVIAAATTASASCALFSL